MIILMLVSHSLSSIALADSKRVEPKNDISKLHTLFTTPGERRDLNALRDSGKFDSSGGTTQSAGPAVRLQPLKVEVKGVMFREQGEPVVWVNKGNTIKSKKIDDNIRVRTQYVKQKSLKVPVKVFDKSLKMKPGQVWQETDKKVKDNYQIKQPKVVTKEAEMENEAGDNDASSQ